MSVRADTMASTRGAGAHRPLLAVLHEWVVTVDHKRLGVMYVVSGLVFLVVAGLEASAMRLQLASSGLHLVPPGTFSAVFIENLLQLAATDPPAGAGGSVDVVDVDESQVAGYTSPSLPGCG